jgi:hypothetical protein
MLPTLLFLAIVGTIAYFALKTYFFWRHRDPNFSQHTSFNGLPTADATAGKNTFILCFGLTGALLGGLIGFLLRPSVLGIGQLPFMVVITRGANLQGLDEVFVPIAETSFNYMLVGVLIGGMGGGIGGFSFFNMKSSASSPKNEMSRRSTPPKSIELGDALERVQAVIGQPEKIVNLGAKVIHIYKDMKIVYVDGKVTDVQ